MDKEIEFQKMANELDKIECPAFALWYMLPEFEKIVEREMNEKEKLKDECIYELARIKVQELIRASKEIREVLAAELW